MKPAPASPTTADPRWARVLARDAAADGSFFYAVSTTGVFCRPSCGARTPRPEHVRFYPTAADAEAAGYRPCKRCRPCDPPLAERHAALVADLCRRIDAADTPPRLADLADAAGLTPHHLQRVFKAVTGLSPRAWFDASRARRLQAGLADSPSVTDALLGAGYPAASRFYTQADAVLGMTPGTWRRGGAGTDIRFAVGQCSLSAILVAATPRGLCAITLGDDPAQLVADLEARFPRARLIAGDADFEQWMAKVIGFVESPRIGLDLPLDLAGTAFQLRVWQALRAIPPGSTLSYTQLAERLGLPKSVRAVAGACAANPLAVAIPCHRVVRVDGALAGYRWGLDRKRTLLDREAAP